MRSNEKMLLISIVHFNKWHQLYKWQKSTLLGKILKTSRKTHFWPFSKTRNFAKSVRISEIRLINPKNIFYKNSSASIWDQLILLHFCCKPPVSLRKWCEKQIFLAILLNTGLSDKQFQHAMQSHARPVLAGDLAGI